MNILSWAALAVLTYCALRGWRRGLIMTVFSMFATVIAIAISAQLSPQLSQTWQNTAFYEMVSERVEMTLFKGQDSQNDGEEGEDNRGVINSLPLPDVVQNVLASNDDAQNNMLGVSEFRKYIADSVTGIILNAISFVLVFAGVSIIMRIIIRCLNLLSRLPVIHTMNKMGGMLVGLLKGLILLWLICIVITIMSGTEAGIYLYGQINESPFLKYIYDNNMIMALITGLKYAFTGV